MPRPTLCRCAPPASAPPAARPPCLRLAAGCVGRLIWEGEGSGLHTRVASMQARPRGAAAAISGKMPCFRRICVCGEEGRPHDGGLARPGRGRAGSSAPYPTRRDVPLGLPTLQRLPFSQRPPCRPVRQQLERRSTWSASCCLASSPHLAAIVHARTLINAHTPPPRETAGSVGFGDSSSFLMDGTR